MSVAHAAPVTVTFNAKLSALDGAGADQFGFSVALSGEQALVGAFSRDEFGLNSGAAYLFDLNGAQAAKLLPDDAAEGDNFGFSVGFAGEHALVGAHLDDNTTVNSGSVYVFDPDGAQRRKITASDAGLFNSFGFAVAGSGEQTLIGARLDGANVPGSGSAYLGNIDGTQEVEIAAGDGLLFDEFGAAVALSESLAIIGAPGNDDNGENSGSVYLFDPDGSARGKVLSADGAEGDEFGFSVDVSSNAFIVGALNDDEQGEDSGSAYIFNNDGTLRFKLTAADGAAGNQFGRAVAISDQYAVVGAAGDDAISENAGAAYVFDIVTGEQIAKLTAPGGALSDQFGFSVDIFAQTILVGARNAEGQVRSSGAAYLFEVSSAIPLPAAAWLFLSGFGAFAFRQHIRNSGRGDFTSRLLSAQSVAREVAL